MIYKVNNNTQRGIKNIYILLQTTCNIKNHCLTEKYFWRVKDERKIKIYFILFIVVGCL